MAILLNMRPDVEVEPHLPDHLADMKRGNNRPRTIRERRLAILRAARKIGHPVAELDKAGLIAWQATLDGLQPAGQHNELSHMACYLKWLHSTERRPDDPSGALIRPKHVHQGLPTPMTEPDIERALAGAPQPLHAWIGLGAFCGLRCCEMAEMARENIVTGLNPYLRVIGKGGKERVVPLPATLLTELSGPDFPATGHLFTRMDGRPGPPSAMRVSERINDYLHSIGIALTAHKLRHRFGTAFYAATRDPFLVAEIMGHVSVDTTRGYVKLVDDRAVAAIEAISHLAA